MTNWEIIPYVSIGQIKFGMAEPEMIQVLGKPKLKRDAQGDEKEVRFFFEPRVTVVVGQGTLGVVEVGVVPSVPIICAGIDVFGDPDAFRKLVGLDGAPREFVGFIVLLKLGITLTGFHDKDPSQLAATAFASGRWDALWPKAKAFELAR